MKLLTNPKCLSDAIAPLMILNYFMGLRTFGFSRGKLRIVFSRIYSAFMLCISCVCAHMYYDFYKSDFTMLKLDYTLRDIIMYVYTFIVTYDMLLNCFYTQQLNDCYRKIAQIDDTLRQLGSTFSYRRIHFCTVGFIIFWFSYVFMIIWTITQADTSLTIMICTIVLILYGTSVSFFLIFEFSIFVKCLETRFRLVNKLLDENTAMSSLRGMKLEPFATKNHSKTTDAEQHVISTNVSSPVNKQLNLRIRTSVSEGSRAVINSQSRCDVSSKLQKQFRIKLQSQFKKQPKDPNLIRKSIVSVGDWKRKHLLQTIRQVHLELCRVSKALCTSFGVQIISEIGTSVMMLSSNLHIMYGLFFQEGDYTSYSFMQQMFSEILLMTFHTVTIVVINHVCKNATDEGKKIAEIIHSNYGNSTDVEIREEVEQFDLQMSQSPVDFFAFSASLNYDFLGSCLSTVLDYLIIMIQLNTPLENSSH